MSKKAGTSSATKRRTTPKTKKKKISIRRKTATMHAAKRKAAASARQKPAAPRAKREQTFGAKPELAPPVQRRAAPYSIYDIVHPGTEPPDPAFRDAPDGWTPAHARAVADDAGLELTEDHWEVVRVLQGCYKDEAAPRLRLLRDALEARFIDKGGMKHLFAILPGGPIVQGCALGGLKPPHGARDPSFGSVA